MARLDGGETLADAGTANVSPIVSRGTEQDRWGWRDARNAGTANITLAEPSSLEGGWRGWSDRLAEVTASVTSLVLDAVTTCVAQLTLMPCRQRNLFLLLRVTLVP
jgi:hypothetical protein